MSDESKKQDQAELDQGFNDAELQDIMSEIESLEQEFTEGASSEVDVADDEDLDSEMMEACAEDEVESEEDEEIFAEHDGFDEEMDEESEPVFAKVTPLASKSPKPASPAAACPMSFSAQGQMEMKMTFAVGDEQVEVWTNADGLNLTMSGVTVQISEQDGCVIEWPGGMKFTLPHSSKAQKKAA